jgi:hypothetical protein
MAAATSASIMWMSGGADRAVAPIQGRQSSCPDDAARVCEAEQRADLTLTTVPTMAGDQAIRRGVASREPHCKSAGVPLTGM